MVQGHILLPGCKTAIVVPGKLMNWPTSIEQAAPSSTSCLRTQTASPSAGLRGPRPMTPRPPRHFSESGARSRARSAPALRAAGRARRAGQPAGGSGGKQAATGHRRGRSAEERLRRDGDTMCNRTTHAHKRRHASAQRDKRLGDCGKSSSSRENKGLLTGWLGYSCESIDLLLFRPRR